MSEVEAEAEAAYWGTFVPAVTVSSVFQPNNLINILPTLLLFAHLSFALCISAIDLGQTETDEF